MKNMDDTASATSIRLSNLEESAEEIKTLSNRMGAIEETMNEMKTLLVRNLRDSPKPEPPSP